MLDSLLSSIYIESMNMTNCTVNMVLTSLVNNKSLLKKVAKDMEDRFKLEIDEDKLEAFLNTVEIDVKNNITLA
jgi:hypothetical protein